MNKKTLSKRVQEVLTTATPKQKAQLICKQWLDPNTQGSKPLLSDEEAIAIRDSFKTDEERKEYNKWIRVYHVYSDLTPYLGLVYKEYIGEAEKMLGLLRVWEAYESEENHLNAILQELIDANDKEGIEAFKRAASHLTFTDAKLVWTEDGYVEIDVTRLYDKIQERLKTVWQSYEAAKAIVLVTDKYTKRTHSSAFRTELLVVAIDQIKEDYALRVAPCYSRSLLQRKKEKGLTITKEEERKAVYPYFEEVNPPQRLIDFFTDQLNDMIAHNERK